MYIYRSSCEVVLLLSDFNQFESSRQIFEKSCYIKFHENLFSGIRVFPHGQTVMMKLIVAFRNFASMQNCENCARSAPSPNKSVLHITGPVLTVHCAMAIFL